MIRKILMLIAVFGICSLATAVWEAMGPYGGYLRCLVLSSSNENLLYVASYSNPTSIAKSTDAGASWTTVGTISDYTYCMAIDPTNPDILYASRYMYVYKSTNGGVDWTSYNILGRYIYGLAVDPLTPSKICAAGNVYESNTYRMAFFKSTNSGVSWNYVTLNMNRSYGYCLVLDPSNSNTIYVGGYYYHPVDSIYLPIVYKSTDGGTNFFEAATGLPTTINDYVYSLAVHYTNPNILYAGLYRGIYRSTDGGGSWTQVSTRYYNYSLANTRATPDVAYCGGYSDMYKTTNAGLSWFSVSSGLDGNYYRGLAIRPSQTTHVYTANDAGFFKSTNSGTNWFESSHGLCLGAIIDMGVAPSSPSTIYTEFENVGVFKTNNNCSDWTKLATPSTCGELCAFTVHNTNPNIVYGLEGTG
jgi:hypothetical protein